MDTTSTVRIVPNPKWVRGSLGGTTVVDSRDVRFVWEHPYYPAWYIPLADVSGELVPTGESIDSPDRGTGTRYDLVVGGTSVSGAATRYLDSPVEHLRDLVRIEWTALDSWFEEDVEVFVHPRSPEVRVDTLRSSKEVRVSLNGVELAKSTRPTLLFETGLLTRYYLPKADVHMELLHPTDTESACPYKGWANYWNIVIDGETHPDLAWGYRTTLPESAAVGGLVCFYNEHVDIEIDGVALERPVSAFTENKFA